MSPNFILALITLLGAFFRFYNLDWGNGYFFHPDEYHIAAAVERISFPQQMNPELFSYGSLTVYLIYFTKLVFVNLHPILIGRFYSALFSTLTIILIYLISRQLFTIKYSLLAAALSATLPGLIQQAHFTTPESGLIFWLFLTLYLWQKKFFHLSAISLGLALGTKITAIAFLPILVILPTATSEVLRQRSRLLRGEFVRLLRLIKVPVLLLLITALTFFFVSPYNLLDWSGFCSSLNYETGVGRGKPVVFYTRQFIKTIPIIFQYQKVFPYALGPIVLFLGTIGFFLAAKDRRLRLMVVSFLVLFLPSAFLFAKWTRFIAPSFPFFVIFTVYLFKKIKNNKLLVSSFCFLVSINFVWCLMFFSIYLRPDVRITATNWLNTALPPDSIILTEAGNMLEAPLVGDMQKTAFDFYHLEEDPELQNQLPKLLTKADYFIIQSRRIFVNHQRLPLQFPKTNRFYNLLFSGKMGFTKIKEFNSYPLISDEKAEETWSVFDHPVIRIYQKTQALTQTYYENLLQI